MVLFNKLVVQKSYTTRPENEFVATFIGRTNIIPARLEKQADGAISYSKTATLFVCQILTSWRTKYSCQHSSWRIYPEWKWHNRWNNYRQRLPWLEYWILHWNRICSKLQVSEESTFEEDLEKGNHVRLRINTQNSMSSLKMVLGIS